MIFKNKTKKTIGYYDILCKTCKYKDNYINKEPCKHCYVDTGSKGYDKIIKKEDDEVNVNDKIENDENIYREFSTGAVRDICEGKGRCDLMPLHQISELYRSKNKKEDAHIFDCIDQFRKNGDIDLLYCAVDSFIINTFDNIYSAILELATHYENGLKKYPERNWEKGIPVHSFIDSAIRHYLKFESGMDDERHDLAFMWNIMGAAWTMQNKPELDDFTDKKKLDEKSLKMKEKCEEHNIILVDI